MPTDPPNLNPDRAQVRDLGGANPWPADGDREIAELRDEVASLTRDRDRWRDRALQAEARRGLRVGCWGAA